jgi:hypothetical protein
MFNPPRSKVMTFIIAETVALGVLVIAGLFAVLGRWNDSTLALSINIVTIAAAVAVAIIPILFFAIAPILPPADH